ncbi:MULTISPECIES: tripartite tricarboxylate transporter TctB family protein [unclassified Cobetia]|uniref:tripartite tricarboxylate transporter TctB family protein n=1 Tax=unclassified Cobetia TaxID=2609414 RepID=UPI000B53ED94|nr:MULTISPECIES: tripartite tricarboxylate transporter TctB family protein [unclassified Cobetia]
MKIAADRILGIALMGLAAFIVAQALSIHVPFAYDPVGPKAFPIGLSIMMAAFSLVLIVRPGPEGNWPSAAIFVQLGLVLLVLIVFAFFFVRLGYPLTAVAAITAIARLFGANWRAACLTGVLMAGLSYLLFTAVLEISLPTGLWFS